MQASHIETAGQRSAQTPPLLEIRGLASAYGRIQVLHGVDLHVRQGEMVALVGANGAGKTTLLRAISGVQPVRAGAVRMAGEDITALRPEKRVRAGLCQVPEGRRVFGPLSVQENLRLGAYTRSPAQEREGLEKAYELFPILKEKRLLPAGTLSGGQQQMLAIARALMARPRLLLLDEPSMGLAPLLVQEIFQAIKRLQKDGLTTLLVEQNAHAALQLADRGYVLETGRMVLEDEGRSLLRNEAVRKAYLGG